MEFLPILVLMYSAINILLLISSDRLSGFSSNYLRILLASAVGGLYAGICIFPSFAFLGNIYWRLIFLGIISVLAYGIHRMTIRRGILFAFLSVALEGVSLWMGGEKYAIASGAIAILGVILVVFPDKPANHYASVNIFFENRKYSLTALVDTGNTLLDPITGTEVLVAGSDFAAQILGIQENMLMDPIKSFPVLQRKGLRLIPYRAVGQPYGMLLGLRLDKIEINGKYFGDIVAFAPQILGSQETFQALVGGNV